MMQATMAASEAVRCPAGACRSTGSSRKEAAALRPSLLQNLVQRTVVRCRPVQAKVGATRACGYCRWVDGSAGAQDSV